MTRLRWELLLHIVESSSFSFQIEPSNPYSIIGIHPPSGCKECDTYYEHKEVIYMLYYWCVPNRSKFVYELTKNNCSPFEDSSSSGTELAMLYILLLVNVLAWCALYCACNVALRAGAMLSLVRCSWCVDDFLCCEADQDVFWHHACHDSASSNVRTRSKMDFARGVKPCTCTLDTPSFQGSFVLNLSFNCNK